MRGPTSTNRRPPTTPKRANRPKHAAPLAEDEAAAWYKGKSFSFDWTSWHFPNWIKLLEPYRRRKLRLLEIGSWEGRSALFFLNYLPQASLVCIDTFQGGQEHQEAAARLEAEARVLQSVEKKFDANTKPFRKRIEKIKARSVDALAGLSLAKRQFDFAYIDGGHRAVEVYADGIMTWPLIAPGGIVLFDDYRWKEMPEPLDNPAPGIDAFLKTIEGKYRVALDDYQIGIIKK